jgi:FG-GAP repeat
VIVASPFHDAGQVDEGAAFVFLGSAAGIASGAPGSAHARLETNQANALVHYVGSAGDVNGDGYGDVLMSSIWFDSGTTDEGSAFVFLGSAAGIANGNPSTAHARFETDQAPVVGTPVGIQASSAGDLNGDGFGDVVVHSDRFDSGDSREGVAFVLLGSSTGITNGNPTTAHARFETNQVDAGPASFSYSPGDVNGDGYADLLVSVPFYTNGESGEGAVFVFNGSGAGMVSGNPTTSDTRIESNQADAHLDVPRVSSSLDVNADGFADLLLGRGDGFGPSYIHFYHGSAAGIPNGDPSSASSTVPVSFGRSLRQGGDINGDGHGDVLDVAIEYLQFEFPFPVNRVFVSSVLSDRGGRPALARQRRGDGSGILVSPGGESHANEFVAELFARSPRGREYGKLEVEYCPGANAVFGAPGCLSEVSPSWVDLGTTGSVLTRTIPGLDQGTSYVWRARARYASYRPTPPSAAIDGVAGPWYRVEGRPLATDIRTPAPEPGLVVGVMIGAVLLATLRRKRCALARA